MNFPVILLFSFLCALVPPAISVIFHAQETLSATQGAVRISFRVNTDKIHETVLKIAKLAEDCHPPAQDHWLFPAWLFLNDTVTRALESVNSWPVFFSPFPTFTPRHKRQIGLMAATIFGATASYFVTEHFEHSGIQRSLNDVRRDLGRIHQNIHRLELFIFNTAKTQENDINMLFLQIQALSLKSLIDNLSNSFATLLTTKKVTPALLPLHNAKNVWSELSGFFRSKGFDLTLPVESLYELQASYELTSEGMTIFIDVPIVRHKLSLYSHASFPIEKPDGVAKPLMIYDNNYLAVDASQTSYVLLSQQELQSCPRIDGHALCPIPYLRKDFDQTCLSSLYGGHWHAAFALCNFTLAPSWSLAHNEFDKHWQLFTEQPLPYSVVCNNASHIRRSGLWKAGFSSFPAEERCEFSSENFRILPAPHYSVKSGFVRDIEWTPELLVIADTVSQKLPDLATDDLIPDDYHAHYFYGFTVLASVVAISAISVLLYLLWRYYKIGPSPTQTQGSD